MHLHTYLMLRYRRLLMHLHTYLMLRYRHHLMHMHDLAWWGGVGWADNVHWHLHTHVMLRCVFAHIPDATLPTSSHALAHLPDATLPTSSHAHTWSCMMGWGGVGWADNVHWHLHTHVMLRCVFAHIPDATLPTFSHALAQLPDATLPTSSHALAHLPDATLPTSSHAHAWSCMMGWGGVGWGGLITYIGTCTHTWCYVVYLHTCLMLRYRRLLMHLHTYLMLRYRHHLMHMHDLAWWGGVGWGGVGW